jgi:NADP-dependent 3-hydroxy acid dehydrogenase YdfG
MNLSFQNKVAFVTGASSGIGRATAMAFARERASVVVADIAEAGNQETARLIEDLGGHALAVKCDVTRSEDVKAALDRTLETFGRLDVAFNNAGLEQPIAAATDIAEDEWDRIIAVNLRGVFLCIKHEIPVMLEHGGGAIVNTSSGAGVIGVKGQAAYTAAKHGVIGLTKVAALDYARIERPGQRGLPRDRRHPDDGAVRRGYPGGTGTSHRAGADRADGESRRDRCGRALAVFRRGLLRCGTCYGRRRRPDRAVARRSYQTTIHI